jgi:chaperonin GroES
MPCAKVGESGLFWGLEHPNRVAPAARTAAAADAREERGRQRAVEPMVNRLLEREVPMIFWVLTLNLPSAQVDNSRGVANIGPVFNYSRRLLTMQVRPLHDRVLVKRFNEEERSKGGIIIPDTAKEKPIQGEIIAVGQGRIGDDGKVRPLDVKKGDRVLFGKYAGTEIKIDGEEFLMMREEDILGVLN